MKKEKRDFPAKIVGILAAMHFLKRKEKEFGGSQQTYTTKMRPLLAKPYDKALEN